MGVIVTIPLRAGSTGGLHLQTSRIKQEWDILFRKVDLQRKTGEHAPGHNGKAIISPKPQSAAREGHPDLVTETDKIDIATTCLISFKPRWLVMLLTRTGE